MVLVYKDVGLDNLSVEEKLKSVLSESGSLYVVGAWGIQVLRGQRR